MSEMKNNNNKVLQLLLGADRGKLTAVPRADFEIKRLSEAIGEPVYFTCRALTPDEYEVVQGIARDDDKGVMDMQRMTLCYGVTEPALKSSELLESFGVSTPDELLASGKLLLPGEIALLFKEIQELTGFTEDSVAKVKN